MSSKEKRNLPASQLVYGEIIYWITVVSALICTIGPVIALSSPEKNVLNPHFLFANIGAGESPSGVWALSASKEPILTVEQRGGVSEAKTEELGPRAAVKLLEDLPRPADGDTAKAELLIASKVSFVRTAEGNEDLYLVTRDGDESRLIFEKAREEVLDLYGRVVFQDGHFWMKDLTTGDGFTQFGLALGCSVALWGLIAAAFCFMGAKKPLFVALSFWVALLVALSAAGIIKAH